MIAHKLALIAASLLLPLAAGQHRPGFPTAFPPQFYRGQNFPPTNLHRSSLRQRRLQNQASPPIFDCGTNPLVKQENGCPCFTAETIASMMDIETDADYCDFYGYPAVNASDQCSQFYPRSASFSASTAYTDTASFSISFGVSSNFDPGMQVAGYCNGGVYYSKYSYDANGTSSNSENHSYDISQTLTKKQLEDCLEVFNEVKASLPAGVCTVNGVLS